MITSLVFLADVFIRRVTLSWEWLLPIITFLREKVFRRDPTPVQDTRLERLRQRKAAVGDEYDRQKAGTRFTAEEPEEFVTLEDVIQEGPASSEKQKNKKPTLQSEPEQESYTSRLLKAKEKARKGS